MQEVTLKVQVAAQREVNGYTDYVFKVVDKEDKEALGLITPYIHATRFPNWKERELNNQETVFVELHFVKAGESYCDSEGKPIGKWKNSYTHFVKVIDIDENSPAEFIMN